MKMNSEPTGLYIHVPFCEQKCRYCGFYSEPLKNHDPTRLISAIINEFQKSGQTPFLPHTVYIGGGSPSCLPEDQLLQLVDCILASAKPSGEAGPKPGEFTIEVNPGQVNQQILSNLQKAGVNRLSIGAQSFNDDELKFLGRRHSADDISRAVKSAKQAGFKNIGLDLIFAIPQSTLVQWEKTLQTAIDLDVQHISAYALTYEENTPLQKAVSAGEVQPVDEETDRAMYETTIDILERAGFKQYEISNFAKPGFECKHNLNYWINYPYLGIGPAAGSYWQGKRTLNVADINKYIDAIEKNTDPVTETETPSPLETACQTAVLNLRRRCGINIKEFKKQTSYDALQLFSQPISKYKELGFIVQIDGKLFLTREALPIADSILCDFSAV
jgi:oxygen-independent coproporphyrinogen-3 oxidase